MAPGKQFQISRAATKKRRKRAALQNQKRRKSAALRMKLDLSRHNLIEASAGTGKTYTIEQLVVRLLVENNIDLENILVVTFTEKATGELKTRLRQRLEQSLAESPLPILRRCLDAFDQAPIFTIH